MRGRRRVLRLFAAWVKDFPPRPSARGLLAAASSSHGTQCPGFPLHRLLQQAQRERN